MTSIIVITSILIASPFAMQTGYAGLFQDVGLTLDGNVIAKVAEGGTATYSFTSTNNGLGYLVDCSLEDNRLGTIGTFDLKEGSVEVITVNAVIYETVANTAILRCFDHLGTEHTVESSTVVVGFDSSATLEKTVDATTVIAGETVTYTYTVVNTGDGNIDCLLLDDKIILGLGNLFFSPGESRIFTADAIISEDTTNIAILTCFTQLDTFSVSDTQTVTIIPAPNPVDKIEGMIIEVEDLGLNHGQENSLVKKLANAIKNITNEDPTDDAEACEKLQSFIDQLNAFVNAGKLTEGEVEGLIGDANDCISALCTPG